MITGTPVRTAAPPDDLARQIQAIDPRDAERCYRAGLQALKQGLEEEGLRLLAGATRANPGDARLWQVQGLMHRAILDSEPAIRAFRRAARLAPSDALIAHSLARVHFEAGLPSTELFEAARALAPRSAEIILGQAAALAAEKRDDEAIATLDHALAESPGWLAGQHALCRLRWQSGQREGFAASLDRALSDYPGDLSLWRTLLVLLTQGNLYEQALDAVARGRAAAGDDPLFDANEAVCRSELGQGPMADRLFARIEQFDDPAVRVRQVRHLLRTGRAADAADLSFRMTNGPAADLFWPYVSAAWRLTGDPRWEWLEGDPRFIGVYDLGAGAVPLPALARRLRALHVAEGQPLEQSVRGGTQTDGMLFARIEPQIRQLRQAILKVVERHVRQLPPPDPKHPTLSVPSGRRIRFSGSWSVRLTNAGYHSNHVHPAGWISSAFYVGLPEAAMGGQDHAGWLTIGEPQAELGLDLAPVRLVEPKPGRLVLFPSTMWHGTRPFAAGERLTVAFDVRRPF